MTFETCRQSTLTARFCYLASVMLAAKSTFYQSTFMSFFRCCSVLLLLAGLWANDVVWPTQAQAAPHSSVYMAQRVAAKVSTQVRSKRARSKRRRSTRRKATSQPRAMRSVSINGTAKNLGVQLVIPEIYLDAPVMQGIDDTALRYGPGHDPLSSQPGVPGNCVIAAHRNVWGAWFWHLPRLKKGSSIELRTSQKIYRYRVVQTRMVPDSDTSALEAPANASVSRLTLYTCTKPRTISRFVVIADLVSTAPLTHSTLARPIWLQNGEKTAQNTQSPRLRNRRKPVAEIEVMAREANEAVLAEQR
jgi:LPXTG-site transpeptidase (sortase) family protein